MTLPSFRRRRWIFIDSSAYYALADASDRNHATARGIFQRLTDESCRLYTTNFVLAETYALLLSRLPREDAVRIFAAYRQSMGTRIVRVRQKDEEAGWEIITRYADKEFSLVDAISFAVMDRLGIAQAFAFDDHFRQYGRLEVLR